MNEGYRLKQLDPLSFPRDYHPLCDLTGLRAKYELTIIQFNNPFVLYYSSREIAEQAYEGIIKKIVHLLIPLTAPAPIIGTAEERAKREANIILSKRSLIDFCLSESSNLLSIQKYSLAVPAATQALKFCKEIDGDKAVAVIEPYLQLAQAYLGLNEHHKSEEFLSLARWIALSSKDCSDGTRYRLHMLMGRVNTVRGNFDAAKSEYASSIYHAACCYGAEAIPTSIGYFRLGDIFLGLGNVESALAFFDKVVDIWYKYLSALHAAATDGTESNAHDLNLHEKNLERAAHRDHISDESLADGHGQLQQVLETRRRLLGAVHIATGEAQFTLGLFELYLIGNIDAANAYVSSAQISYESQLGPDHPSAIHVILCLEMIALKLRGCRS